MALEGVSDPKIWWKIALEKFAPDRWVKKCPRTPPRRNPEKRKETPMVSDWTREVTQQSGNALLSFSDFWSTIFTPHPWSLTNGSPWKSAPGKRRFRTWKTSIFKIPFQKLQVCHFSIFSMMSGQISIIPKPESGDFGGIPLLNHHLGWPQLRSL